MAQNNGMIQTYLAEGLVALLPDYRGEGGGTEVITLQGLHRDPRSLPWLVEVLARFYRLDLGSVRRHTGRLLELRHHIPLPLAEGLVLLPVKVRRAVELGEHTAGYVNLLQVEAVEKVEGGVGGKSSFVVDVARDDKKYNAASPTDQMVYLAADPALIRSRIICCGGLVICCLNTAATVKAKLHQGELAKQELLQRQKLTTLPAASFTGLDGGALRELLPDCDCLLRSILLLLLEKTSRPDVPELEPERREPAATVTAGKE